MVVGRGHGHDLLGADHVADVPEADGVADRAGRDDRALADHEPRDGGDRADTAGVRQRDVPAGEVVGAERVRARLLDQGVERGLEVAELLAARVADDGHHQGAAAVLLLDVDGDPRFTLPSSMRCGLPSISAKWWAITGGRAGGQGDGIGDQVRERDAQAGVLELLAPAVHRRDGDRAERGRGRDRPALVHVAGEHARAAAERLRGPAGRRGGGRGAGAGVAVAGPPLAAVARTSALVMRPPGPEPRTPARSIPSTAAMRAATGEIFASAGRAAGACDAALPSPGAASGPPGRRASRPRRRSSPSSSAR